VRANAKIFPDAPGEARQLMEESQETELRARVFISCGQNKESDEVVIASAIRDRLQELGFDPYIAVQEQTLRGLKENIFRQLSECEYFIFVDFRRERLGPFRGT
jgi:hypothetical protein